MSNANYVGGGAMRYIAGCRMHVESTRIARGLLMLHVSAPFTQLSCRPFGGQAVAVLHAACNLLAPAWEHAGAVIAEAVPLLDQAAFELFPAACDPVTVHFLLA